MEPYEINAWAYADYSDPASPAKVAFQVVIKTPIRCPYCNDELRVAWAVQGWAGHPFAFGARCPRCPTFLVRWRLDGFRQKTVP